MASNPRIGIVGSGPNGISLSRTLVEKGFMVTLYESGGQESEGEFLSKSNYIFESPSLMPEKVHLLGGGSNQWIGRIGEFLAADFKSIEGLRNEGWPIGLEDLEQYYTEMFSKLADTKLSDKQLLKEELSLLGITPPENLDFRIIRYSSKSYFQECLSYLESQNNFQLKTFSKCEMIAPTNSGGFEISIRTPDGMLTDFCDCLVLSCGALQTPALILRSNELMRAINPELIGSFLMEHFDGFVGEIFWRRFRHENLIKKVKLNRNRVISRKRNLGLGLKLSEEYRTNLGLLNLHLEVVPREKRYFFRPERFIRKSLLILVLYYLERIFRKVVSLISSTIGEIIGRRTFSVWVKAELLPNSNSKIEIFSPGNLDERIIYAHKVSQETRLAFLSTLNKLANELDLARVGEFKIKSTIIEGTDPIFEAPNWHPMGTCRMGSNSGEGVCDSDLRLFGQTDIYLCDASVFPTGSNANPTFTALALGLRLANHLEERFL
jgi:hypothetical protein